MIRIGVDFGGTKIEAAAIDGDGQFQARLRRANPRTYEQALEVVAELVAEVEAQIGQRVEHVGVGIPGSQAPSTGTIRYANSTWLNGRRLDDDLQRVLGRRVTLENDANCFALSEALPDHADKTLVGVIVGTGCGSGVVVGGRVRTGRNALAGEWSHTPLPWMSQAELDRPACWCGRANCIETFVCGPAFEADYARQAGQTLPAAEIVALAGAGDQTAARTLTDYIDRLARALAILVHTIDPDIIVLGGGMSNTPALAERVRQRLSSVIYPAAPGDFLTEVRTARHGDSSGVRGAAWLVPR